MKTHKTLTPFTFLSTKVLSSKKKKQKQKKQTNKKKQKQKTKPKNKTTKKKNKQTLQLWQYFLRENGRVLSLLWPL